MKTIIAVKNTFKAVTKIQPKKDEKYRLYENWTHDFCDTGIVL